MFIAAGKDRLFEYKILSFVSNILPYLSGIDRKAIYLAKADLLAFVEISNNKLRILWYV